MGRGSPVRSERPSGPGAAYHLPIDTEAATPPDPSQVNGLRTDDEIQLTLPANTGLARVARLAVTGLAARVGHSYDEIEDLRIAVGEICGILLDGSDSQVTFRCRIGADALHVEATRRPEGTAPEVSELSRQILEAVVDSSEIDPERARVRVTKRRQA